MIQQPKLKYFHIDKKSYIYLMMCLYRFCKLFFVSCWYIVFLLSTFFGWYMPQITLHYLRFAANHSDGALAPNKPGRVAPPRFLQNFSRSLSICSAYSQPKNSHFYTIQSIYLYVSYVYHLPSTARRQCIGFVTSASVSILPSSLSYPKL